MKKITFLFALCAMFMLSATKASAEIGDALENTVNWSISASSWCDEDGTSGAVAAAIDGNIGTYWHSNWGGTGEGESRGGGSTTLLATTPEYLILDLGEVVSNIGGVGYVPRNDGSAVVGNGALLDYKLYVSETEFTVPVNCTNTEKQQVLALEGEVAAGTLSDADMSEKFIATEAPVSGRYIMLVWLSGGGPGGNGNYHATCAELNVYGYTADAKPALIGAIAAFQAKVDGATVGTEYGNYAQETINAANEAIAAAQVVVDKGTSTDEEEIAAAEALAEAVAAFQPINPTGLFKLVSGCSAFFNQQGVRKALYASAAGVFAWGTENSDSKPFYWNITVAEDGKLNIQNAAYGTYISGMGTLSETAAGVTYSSLGSGQFALQCGGTIHANGHKSGAGVGGNIVTWTTEADGASAWIFETVDEIPAAAEEAWAWIVGDMENPLMPGKRVATLEDGKQYFVFNTAIDGTQDRTGFLNGNGSGFGLDKTRPSELVLTKNAESSYLWTVKASATEGAYNIMTYDGKYINLSGAASATPVDLNIEEFSASSKKAGANSLAEDGETVVANAEVTADNHVWAVSGADGMCWNGNPETFATWLNAHPFAFYEVYTSSAEQLAAITEAKELIALTGAGYPAADAAERLALDSIVSLNPSTEGHTEGLVAAIAAFKACTNVTLPEAGKVYTITSVQSNGSEYYFGYTPGERLQLVPRTEEAIPDSSAWVCRVTEDGKFVFVNLDKQFLLFRHNDGKTGHATDAGYNDNYGYQSVYDANNELVVSQMVPGSYASASQEEFFGLLMMRGYRAKADDPFFVIKNDGTFDGASAQFYNASYSSALRLEEVADFEVPYIEFDSVSVEPGVVEALPDTLEVEFSEDIQDVMVYIHTDLMEKGESYAFKAGHGPVVNGNKLTIGVPEFALEGVSTYTLTIQATDIYGGAATYGDAPGYVNLTYSLPATDIDAAILEITSVEQAEGNKFVVTVFDPNAMPALGGGDGTMVVINEAEDAAPVVVKNAAGDIVAYAVLGYGEGMNQVEVMVEEIAEAGEYTLVIPEATLWNGMYDPYAEDFGVSFGAIYNAEYTYNFTVEDNTPKLTITGITPEAGSTVAELSTITMTFSEAIAIWSDTPKLTNAAGEVVCKLTYNDVALGEDGKSLILTLPTAITAPGEYTLVVDAGVILAADYQKVNEAATFKLTVGTVDGIDGVAVDGVKAVYYDLSGRVVANPVKGGLYIVNGKKVIK